MGALDHPHGGLGTLQREIETGQLLRDVLDDGPLLFDAVKAPCPSCYRCQLGKEYPSCDMACAMLCSPL